MSETPPPLPPATAPWLALRRIRLPAIAQIAMLSVWFLPAGFLFMEGWFETDRSAIKLGVSGGLLILLGLVESRIYRLTCVADLVRTNADPRTYATEFTKVWRGPVFDPPTAETTPAEIAANASGPMLCIGYLGIALMLACAGALASLAVIDYHSDFSRWWVQAVNIPFVLFGVITCRELISAARNLGPDSTRLATALEHHRRFWICAALLHFLLLAEMALYFFRDATASFR